MNKKKILIEIIIALVLVIAVIYNFFTTNEENIDLGNIVQNIPSNEDVIEETKQEENMKIHITGEIKNPGIIELKIGSRIADAIEKAGGVTSLANLENVNLAYELEDGQKLYIPNINETKNEYVLDGIDSNIVETTNFSNANKIININKASEIELQEIPGVGPSMAKKIITYREENGKFKNIEDIKNVSGIGEKKFENIKEYITIK